jgi:hypothetical protein
MSCCQWCDFVFPFGDAGILTGGASRFSNAFFFAGGQPYLVFSGFWRVLAVSSPSDAVSSVVHFLFADSGIVADGPS